MRFSVKCLLELTGSVLLWSGIATGASVESARIRVLVNNSSDVSAPVLRLAESEASRVFSAAGIEIAWINCMSERVGNECLTGSGRYEFVLQIVPTGKTSSDSVFGVAFLGEDGRGKYGDVFFDRIQNAGRTFGAPVARLLGAVSAHELGHLLLGFRGHSNVGIMAPMWGEESLREVGMGTLLFTPEQSKLMRSRIEQRTLLVSWRDRSITSLAFVLPE
jgi:hypothetical protein